MELSDVQKLHRYGLEALTLTTQGIEKIENTLEVYTARGGTAAIEALKYTSPSTPEEEEYNAEIDDLLADIAEIGPVANALSALFSDSHRETMMKLRTDI